MTSIDEKKFVLFLGSLRAGCGNRATAFRIVDQIQASTKFVVDCLSVDESTAELNVALSSIRKYSIVLALHAFRAGRLLTEIYKDEDRTLPRLVIIFAGTDLHSCEPSWIPTLNSIVPRADALVCFSYLWKKNAQQIFAHCISCPIFVIPQSFRPPATIIDSTKANFLRDISQKNLILWIGELRIVKDPLCAMEIVSYLNFHDFHLFMIGSELDLSLTEEIRAILPRPNITLLGVQPQKIVHQLMKIAFAYLNTSINEGMSLTIVEAMNFGLPVVARRNIGNASLIEHQTTGLLFDTVEQAVSQLQRLENDQNLRNRLTQQASDYVKTSHNYEDEANAYQKLLESLLV